MTFDPFVGTYVEDGVVDFISGANPSSPTGQQTDHLNFTSHLFFCLFLLPKANTVKLRISCTRPGPPASRSRAPSLATRFRHHLPSASLGRPHCAALDSPPARPNTPRPLHKPHHAIVAATYYVVGRSYWVLRCWIVRRVCTAHRVPCARDRLGNRRYSEPENAAAHRSPLNCQSNRTQSPLFHARGRHLFFLCLTSLSLCVALWLLLCLLRPGGLDPILHWFLAPPLCNGCNGPSPLAIQPELQSTPGNSSDI